MSLAPLARRPSARTVVSVAIVGVCVAFTLLQLHPELLLEGSTPAGGDMGAHVWAPAFLRDHLLPDLRVTGWTNDWYAGFPALHFYFPLPSLVIVALNAVLAYGVAFKLVAVAGVLTLPIAAYWCVRLLQVPFPAPALAAAATLPFLFDRFHTIYGGNIAATLAGEFSFSIALSLGVLFLGVFARGLETGRYRAWCTVLLAATFLSHLLPTFYVAVGALVLLATRLDRRRLLYAATTLPLAAALAGFWAIPFGLRLPYSNDMGWEKIKAYTGTLLPFLNECQAGGSCAPGQFPRTQTWHLGIVVVLAGVGLVVGLARRRRATVLFGALAAVSALAFRYAPDGRLWNARALPFWFLSLYFLAALGSAEVLAAADLALRRRREAAAAGTPTEALEPLGDPADADLTDPEVAASPRPRRAFPLAPVGAVVAAFLVLTFVGQPLGRVLPGIPRTTDRSFVRGWAEWNFSGYEKKTAYPEYRDVVATMGRVGIEHGCGRALWEYKPELDQYGTPMALMLLPMWTDGCIGSMEGLYFESAASTPYHFLMQSELSNRPSSAQRDLPYRGLDVASGVEHLQLMGVRYYMAVSPEAIAQAEQVPDLEVVASSGPWRIYRVADSPLVEPLRNLPAVATGYDLRSNGHWMDLAVPWFQDRERRDVALAADGPASWPRVAVREVDSEATTVGADVEVEDPPARAVRPVRVSDIRLDDDGIEFDVDRPGTPVVVKVSYFPNWKASGADGPWRIAPNLMVVVPTTRHVELSYGRTAVDWAGMAVSLLALAAVVLLHRRGPVVYPPQAGRAPRRRRAGAATPGDGADATDLPPDGGAGHDGGVGSDRYGAGATVPVGLAPDPDG